jgi:hypothetical protein
VFRLCWRYSSLERGLVIVQRARQNVIKAVSSFSTKSGVRTTLILHYIFSGRNVPCSFLRWVYTNWSRLYRGVTGIVRNITFLSRSCESHLPAEHSFLWNESAVIESWNYGRYTCEGKVVSKLGTIELWQYSRYIQQKSHLKYSVSYHLDFKC